MLSIAMFSNSYHPMRNGVVVSVSTLARLLTDMGHRVTIFTARHPEVHEAEAGVYRFPSITLPIRTRYPLAIPVATGEAREMLADEHFDVIHSHYPVLMGQVAMQYARHRKLPLVFTYHTLLEEYAHYVPLPHAWARHSAIQISRYYSNAADHVITPTEHVASRLRSYHVVKPITVIPTGIDLELFDHATADGVRVRYDIPDGAPLLVYAGRIAREKNMMRLLTAFKDVLRSEPDAFLLLVGGGPLEPAIHGALKELGIAPRVRVTGYVPREEVARALKAADLFVFASRTETQGLVIGEAMACGVPIVAVAADAPCELVIQGEDGLLTPDADAPFAEAVITLLHDADLRRRLAQNARGHAEALSAQRCAERIVDVYRQVLTVADSNHCTA